MANPELQPLVLRGHLSRPGSEPREFTTLTPPDVHKDTIIIAAAAPNVNVGKPSVDGWFLSDFYAFNAILKDLGHSQKWLTAAVSLNRSDRSTFFSLRRS
jgi:hypothetical protein